MPHEALTMRRNVYSPLLVSALNIAASDVQCSIDLWASPLPNARRRSCLPVSSVSSRSEVPLRT